MRVFLVVFLLSTSVGCSTLPNDPYWQAEVAWQIGHGVDVLQTINGPARDDCYVEGDSITRSLIGENPNTGEVLVWGAATGLLHYGISKGLERVNAKPWVKIAWQSVTLVYKADAIIDNHREGIRPWGLNVGPCNGVQGIDRIVLENN